MKANNSRRSARVSSKKVTMTNTAKGLTSQAGLLPVVKFLRHNGAVSLIKDTIEHERGNNALYDCVDALFSHHYRYDRRSPISKRCGHFMGGWYPQKSGGVGQFLIQPR